MQKTFIKYTFIIMTSAIMLILVINFLFTLNMLENRQFDTFYAKTEQMIHTLQNNEEELHLLNQNLDEDYLTRARAAAYVFERQKEVSMNVSEMQYLADLLNVDELHIIDETGFIVSSSVSEYIGIDMDNHPQTRPFLAILESRDEDAYLVQDAQPNAAEGRIMQYVGVARKGAKGVVQVGFKPTRQLDAQSRNTYDYIFSRFPTDIGEELYVVDAASGTVLGHSDGLHNDFDADCYQLSSLLTCKTGGYKEGRDGQNMYVFCRAYEDVLLCAALPQSILIQRLWRNLLATLSYLLFIEAAVILLLNYLVRQKVTSGIHHIIDNLSAITNGNLDTTVCVGGNREFEELSRGINTMVKSITHLTDRISAIIEISGISLAAFEYENSLNRIFVTSGFGGLLDLSEKQTTALYKSPAQFASYINELTQTPIRGEEDIFQISEEKYVRIHMTRSSEGYLGIISDVTKDVLQKKQMQYENTHDPLTKLYKFDYFKQQAAEILQKMPAGKICALVMIDLDNFKSINDTYGHDMGDEYLRTFAASMASLSPEHFLFARRSGDEFCMMLHDCESKEDLIRYLDVFYETFQAEEIPLSQTDTITISASSGFAWTNDQTAQISDLLAHADEALYHVKKTIKGRYAEFVSETAL